VAQDMPLIAIVVGFAGGAVMASLINHIVGWWRRPIIKVELVPDVGCYVTTKRGNPPTHDAKFLRLRVKNIGNSSIKACRAYVTRITKRNGGKIINDNQEVVELNWAHRNSDALDIPVGAFLYLDIVSLDIKYTGGSILSLCVSLLPNNLSGLFSGPAEFELSLNVACDNARPKNRTVKFTFDPNESDLDFSFD